MASLGAEQQISSNSQTAEPVQRGESREGSVERKATATVARRTCATPVPAVAIAANAAEGSIEAQEATMLGSVQITASADAIAADTERAAADAEVVKDRDEKLKLARERQNEERQRKIEELKAQAEAAQRYREQKEEERRRRIEEIRTRDTEKRHQVEERKRAIMEAEKERREYIIRKNQERENRFEVKKRERNSIGFAFGSSTPRLLEPADFGMVSPSTFWGQRRSTSISNVAGASLSRRSSERELADSATKKRATSASGTDRNDDHRRKSSSMYEVFNWGYTNDEPPKRYSLSIVGAEINIDEPAAATITAAAGVNSNSSHNYSSPSSNNNSFYAHRHYSNHYQGTPPGHNASSAKEENIDASHIVFRSVARRKTDLMPTIPSPRDGHYGSRSSLSNTPRTPGSRSGNVTPGGSISTSRPGSAMSTSTTMSTSGFVQRRAVPAVRKPRPASIAGTGVSLEEMNKLRREQKPPLKTATPLASAQTTPKRNVNLMSTSLIVTSTSSRLSSGERKTPTKRESITPKSSSTPKSLPRTASSERLHKVSREKLKEPSAMSKSALFMTPPTSTTANNVVSSVVVGAVPSAAEEPKKLSGAASADAAADITKEEKNVSNNSVMAEEQSANHAVAAEASPLPLSEITATNDGDSPHAEKADDGNEKSVGAQQQTSEVIVSSVQKSTAHNGVELMPSAAASEGAADLMTASMIAKSKITTEEEAKAALAERRRLAREEAERQAELERLRVEAEMLAEVKRQEEEAERQRQFEEESTRLAEQQRRAEDERLRQAIEEAKLREEEERRKREDDERQRIEREEADKKAKEEAEKQRLEVAERLKREEKEREERRKRVEAIMSRTRKGGGATNTPNSTPVKENNDSAKKSPNDAEATPQSQGAPESQQQQLLHSVTNSSESGSTSGSTTEATTPTPPAATQTPAVAVAVAVGAIEPQNTQAMYEQSVIDKEMALINSFSNMIMDENAKNLQQLPTQIVEVANGKMLNDIGFPITAANNEALTTAVSNGNGHIGNINNKNDINLLQDVVVPATNQLIDLSIDSQDMNINNAISYDNNNSLLATTTTAMGTPTAIAANTLVTADSHENKDISLL